MLPLLFCVWILRLCHHLLQAVSPPMTALPPVQLQQLSPAWLSWFQQRGISPTVLARNRVGMERRYVAPLQKELECAAFPFFQAGQLVNVKYRAMPKHFSQVKQGQQVFYGIDDLQVHVGDEGCCLAGWFSGAGKWGCVGGSFFFGGGV